MTQSAQKIAVFTSGGDAPGMNACIRAVVRACIYYGKEVCGIMRGYQGMIEGDIREMNERSVSYIIHRGGTILKSARSDDFRTAEGRKKAYENLKANGIDALVAIGGDGTFAGASVFFEEYGLPVIGIPGTIDNDLYGTDYTIGFDTAANTAMEAIDKIRDTASSHSRLFFVEVMGRDAGGIAVRSGVSVGAVATIIPERKMTLEELHDKLQAGKKTGKSSSLIIVAEGGGHGSAIDLAKTFTENYPGYDTRVTILGHLQRGGSPSSFDRMLASRLGVAAVEALIQGRKGLMAGMINNQVKFTRLSLAINNHSEIDEEIIRISEILSI